MQITIICAPTKWPPSTGLTFSSQPIPLSLLALVPTPAIGRSLVSMLLVNGSACNYPSFVFFHQRFIRHRRSATLTRFRVERNERNRNAEFLSRLPRRRRRVWGDGRVFREDTAGLSLERALRSPCVVPRRTRRALKGCRSNPEVS